MAVLSVKLCNLMQYHPDGLDSPCSERAVLTVPCMLCELTTVCVSTPCRDLVSELSSLRNTQGFWRPSARLQAVLLCKTAANRNSSNTADGTPDGTPDGTLESTGVSHDGKHSSPNSSETAADRHTGDSSTKVSDLGPRLNASRPKECEDNDIWATVLVLGFLSKHCASEQQLWSDMQSKAVLWLRSTAWGASSSVPVAVAVAGRSLV